MLTRLTLHRHPLSSSKFVSLELRKRLSILEGLPVQISFLPALSVGGRKLYSGRSSGQPVYAATFIRKREIILDRELQRQPRELARILTHELFHFAWVRLSNQARRSYEALLLEECKLRARGELGWSAESRKVALPRRPSAAPRPTWSEYVCESFCDTAAWLYSGIGRHPEFTLAERHRKRREDWFRQTFQERGIPV